MVNVLHLADGLVILLGTKKKKKQKERFQEVLEYVENRGHRYNL